MLLLKFRKENVNKENSAEQMKRKPFVPVAGASVGSRTSMSKLTCSGLSWDGLMDRRARLVTYRIVDESTHFLGFFFFSKRR